MVETLLGGLAHQRAGRQGMAEAAYRHVLDTKPDEPHALHYLGLLALEAKRAEDAIALLGRAMALRPEHDMVRLLYGRALLAAGRAEDAAAHFEAFALARPNDGAPRANLALAKLRRGDQAATIADADTALRFDRTNSDAWFAKGTALAQLRRTTEAVVALQEAVAHAPDHAEAHLNLGNALFDLDRRDQAEAHLRRAAVLDPSLAEAHASLGCLLSGDGRHDQAIAACARAIKLRPDFAQAHWNQSFAYMLSGDYGPGWEKYEWRKRHDQFARHLMVLPGREWQGEPIAGQTVLVRAEQGLGDTIQFARYLPMLTALGANVVLACAAPLHRLLSRVPAVQVVASSAALPEYDVWVDQMSLPRLFGTRVDSIPVAGGYLAADGARAAHWRAVLPPGFRVGVVWAGNPAHSNDHRRSMPFAALAALLAVPGCRFVSLQVGPRSGEAASAAELDERSTGLDDLADTAALVAALDLVVSVDSCVAHLAGALGVPAWILLPFAPDWRWMANRTDSPWYRSVRLFRQARPGDWSGVIAAVVAELITKQHIETAG